MRLTEQEVETIRQFFRTKPVLKAWLFGSYARGEADATSDVDLLISLDHSQAVGWGYGAWGDALAALLRKKVDVVAPSRRPTRFKQEIAPDLELLYEKAA